MKVALLIKEKIKRKSYILNSQNVAFNLGLCYKKDAATDACIFIQTKEKSPNANCVQTQSGAGGRTRTGTVSPPVDFESTTSANSITPADALAIILYLLKKSKH